MDRCDCLKNIENKYLKPSLNFEELIIFSDLSHSTGIIDFKSETFVCDKEILEILLNLFIYKDYCSVLDLIKSNDCMEFFIKDLISDNFFEITNLKPLKVNFNKIFIKKGAVINNNSKFQSIKAEFDGYVYKSSIYKSIVYFFEATENMVTNKNSEGYLILDKNRSVVKTSKLINGQISNVSPNDQSTDLLGDSNCLACSACGACGICILCAEVNFAAAVATATATINTINFE